MQVRRVSWSEGTLTEQLLEKIGRLRIVAWETDGERPSFAPQSGDIWLDEHDYHGEHFVAEYDMHIVGAARICVHSAGETPPDWTNEADPDSPYLVGFVDQLTWPAAFLNRMVVHPDYRGQGLSSKFDLARLKYAEARQVKSVMVSTHVQSRIEQLLELGFADKGKLKHVIVLRAPTHVFIKHLGE